MNNSEQKSNTQVSAATKAFGGNNAAGNVDTDTVKKQSTSRQFVVIVFILAFATKMFLLPIFLIQSAGRDAYIVLCIGCAIELVMLALYIISVHIAKANFFDLLQSVVGKVCAKIIVAVIGLFLFFKLNIAVAEIMRFYSDSVFGDFNIIFMIVPVLIFFAAIANHTLRAICRLNELMLPLIIVCIAVLIAVVVMTWFDLANVFPAMQDRVAFNDSLLHHAAWLGDFTPLILFVGRTDVKKRTGLFASASGTIGTAVAVFFAIVLCAAFGNVPMLIDSSTNLSNILQYSIGNVYGRIDLISSILWSIAAFIEAALFFYSACRCFEYVIGKNAHFWVAIVVCVVLYCTQVFVMTDPTMFSVVVTSWAASIMSVVITVAVPILVLICALVAKSKNGSAPALGSDENGETETCDRRDEKPNDPALGSDENGETETCDRRDEKPNDPAIGTQAQ